VEVVLAVLWVLLASACGWLGFHLAMQNGRLMLRIESLEALLFAKPGSVGLPGGSTLRNFSLPLLSGGTMTLSQWRGRKLALIFTRPGCDHSEQMLPELSGALANGAPGGLVPLIISTGGFAENRRFFEKHQIACPVLFDEDSTVARSYRVLATPMAFVVDERGTTVGNALVGTGTVLELFLPGTATGERAADDCSRISPSLAASKILRDGLKAGVTAPEFRLPTIEDGNEISFGALRGRPLLLVFSDPNCQPCRELAPRLEEVHRNSPDLQVLMISRGDRDLNREKSKENGLTFPVALQAHWEVSRAYGTFATPSGYLVDEHGVLATDLAVGMDAILRLVAPRQTVGVRPGAEQQVPAALKT
jgi:peroxiredoxin